MGAITFMGNCGVDQPDEDDEEGTLNVTLTMTTVHRAENPQIESFAFKFWGGEDMEPPANHTLMSLVSQLAWVETNSITNLGH